MRMAMVLNGQLLACLMTLMMMMKMMTAASFESRDATEVVISMEAGVANGTMIDERIGKGGGGGGGQEREFSHCDLKNDDDDKTCICVCYPYVGNCKPKKFRPVCECTREVFKDTTCKEDDQSNCQRMYEDGTKCECRHEQCYCEMHAGGRDFVLQSDIMLVMASEELCNEDGTVKQQACPNKMLGQCLLLMDPSNHLKYQYHCLVDSDGLRGLIKLTDANSIYVPLPTNEHLLPHALYLHSVCANYAHCPQGTIGYLGSDGRKPSCVCLKITAWLRVPRIQAKAIPCRVNGEWEDLKACKSKCNTFQYGHCELEKGDPAAQCLCSNPLRHSVDKFRKKLQ